MSEVTSRSSASRGRGSGRGGRGGFAGRGGRRPNGDKPDTVDSPAAFDDDAGLGELRKLYGDKTSVIREMFPDWSEADVLFALQETNGDQSEAVTRIADGRLALSSFAQRHYACQCQCKNSPWLRHSSCVLCFR